MTSPARAFRPAPPRLGFLGIGWTGLRRLESVVRLSGAEIAAVCDPARDRVARARAQATGAHVCSSFDEMLDLDLDGIVVGAPGALQAQQCIECLDWGLPVFCQKPLSRNADEATAVVLEAQSQDCLLDVDLSFRHLLAVEALMDLARGGELGDLYAARLSFHNSSGPDQSWFYDPRLSGGGCVADLGIHLIDLAVRMMGSPVESVTSGCFAGGERLEQPLDRAEDYATARLRLESGAVVDLACSWNAALGQDAVIEADFFGTRGGARLRNVGGSFQDFTAAHTTGAHSRVLVEPSDDSAPRALASWARRLAQGEGSFDCEAWELVHLARVIDEIYGRPHGAPEAILP